MSLWGKLGSGAVAAAMLASVALVGCKSPEGKAKETLGKYEIVFSKCKELHDEMKMDPGTHRCSKVASLAVEMGLKDSGLPEAEWRKLLDEWLKEKNYSAYYLDPSKNRKD